MGCGSTTPGKYKQNEPKRPRRVPLIQNPQVVSQARARKIGRLRIVSVNAVIESGALERALEPAACVGPILGRKDIPGLATALRPCHHSRVQSIRRQQGRQADVAEQIGGADTQVSTRFQYSMALR